MKPLNIDMIKAKGKSNLWIGFVPDRIFEVRYQQQGEQESIYVEQIALSCITKRMNWATIKRDGSRVHYFASCGIYLCSDGDVWVFLCSNLQNNLIAGTRAVTDFSDQFMEYLLRHHPIIHVETGMDVFKRRRIDSTMI